MLTVVKATACAAGIQYLHNTGNIKCLLATHHTHAQSLSLSLPLRVRVWVCVYVHYVVGQPSLSPMHAEIMPVQRCTYCNAKAIWPTCVLQRIYYAFNIISERELTFPAVDLSSNKQHVEICPL